jgi:hypothetical protein
MKAFKETNRNLTKMEFFLLSSTLHHLFIPPLLQLITVRAVRRTLRLKLGALSLSRLFSGLGVKVPLSLMQKLRRDGLQRALYISSGLRGSYVLGTFRR